MESIKHLKKTFDLNPKIEVAKSKIKISTKSRIHIISKSEILYLKSDSNYCEVVMLDGKKVLCSQTLKSLEQKLDSTHFFRPHNSYVFNITFLASVNASMDEIALQTGKIIPVSRSKRSELKSKLEVWFD